MRELPPSRRAEIDDLLWNEATPAATLRAVGYELITEVDRLRVQVAKLTLLLEQTRRDASAAIADQESATRYYADQSKRRRAQLQKLAAEGGES
ncbi:MULTISPECIES: hypothetical protein [Streptomyces]|uniref:Uncharacterized protein n=2 Tax=Streptomyces rimosus subsp. rimosus TaxID=132474 RepID=L8EZF8_STRR1|nr:MULTISPECIES: hypothetical protein [Streptomyces]KOG70570.1 hypothetical protein ADK78_28725 [Kitasatospora aureofaciens]KPC86524.1 hypothetical protein ADL35_11245 [Streptomyces sp. NRRL WC-3753]MYT47356.1 hypothetical protein [Streptomyces sp. SID5471]KEF04686.1 hypothetical protein DF17_22625 [Streptomyces rimosus]KEF19902.1 hypothetical protein DF18_13745 [Streptomyces rimosus]